MLREELSISKDELALREQELSEYVVEFLRT
jgi:hypothetical protein